MTEPNNSLSHAYPQWEDRSFAEQVTELKQNARDYLDAVIACEDREQRDDMRMKFFVDLATSLVCLKPIPDYNEVYEK